MNKYVLEKYIPFEKVRDFYILHDELNNEKNLLYVSNKTHYSLTVKNNGYIPKSGLIYIPTIERMVKGKKVLDLGSGQLGILAIHSIMSRSKRSYCN